jgi:acetylornithine deacetylase/succinyl-diaminopimelate desuccinylase-like protein
VLLSGIGIVISAVVFGIVTPWAPAEAPTIVVFVAVFAFAGARGYAAIRRREIARHREWMIRMYAAAIAIATIRVVAGALAYVVPPTMEEGVFFVLSLWVGWVATMAFAEVWIHRTRRTPVTETVVRDRGVAAAHADYPGPKNQPSVTHRAYLSLIVISVLGASSPVAAQTPLTPYQFLGRDILRELVETNTEFSIGSTTRAAEKMAARFRAAGFPASDVMIVGPDTGRDANNRNLVVRYRGAGRRRPILLIGHLDVVEARPSDWVLDPFTLTERDGHFYGRGTLDMKNGDASWVAALLRMKQEGVVPAGDYILALTAGEEGGGGYNGIEWLMANAKGLVDAEYVLNADAGGGELRDGKPTALDVQAAEKVFHSVRLTARNPGGHSSLPRKDNAIYALAAALGRIAAYEFPVRTNAVTRGYFARTAPLMAADVAADMRAVSASEMPDAAAAARLAGRSAFYNAQLRTTCVATLLQAGHAENALPQTAQATVNCRMLPGTDAAEVEATLRRVVGDTSIAITPVRPSVPSPPSSLPSAIEGAIAQVTRSVWGALPIVPNMETGATDGLYLRNAGIPVYGVSGLFVDPTIDEDNRAHGLNERIGVKAYYDQLEFTYRLLKAL